VSPPERHHYGSTRSQYAELFLPDGGEPLGVAVVLHGGFWRARYGRKLMHPLCADLVARGWAAWNVEYRRLGALSGGGYPRTLADVAAAVDHLQETCLARFLHGRVVAIGHSAGGHLAAWLATRNDARVAVTGVVAQAGVLDLRLASALGLSRGVVHRFLGGTPEAVPAHYALASPAERLPLGVPALLTQGGRDDIVPPEMSERFAIAARAAGDSVDVVMDAEAGHFEHLDPASGLWQAVTAWLG
jgi:acetyl esterase/lipase